MSTSADKIDSTPMAKLMTQLVGTSPMDLANLGKSILGMESGPTASQDAKASGSGIFGSIKEALVGGDIPERAPLAQPQVMPSAHVANDELFTFVAQQFDGAQRFASRDQGFRSV